MISQPILTLDCLDIIIAKEVETTHKFGDKTWLGFEYATMTPLCQKLIEPSFLSEAEKKWINNYHAKVWENTSGYFEKDELTRAWLKRETQPL